MMIQISGQYGDPKADKLFWPLQKKLNDCFKRNLTGIYFNELSKFSIVFRVSGKVRDFGTKGPERMKHIKSEAEMTIDLVFSEACWRSVDKSTIHLLVAEEVQKCLFIMLENAEALGNVIDSIGFKNDVAKAMIEFRDN